jgi:heme/copper-type cytochrome/quinol oxidase subunit 2
MLSSVWVPIIVAVIMGPVVVVLQKLRKENTDQHAQGQVLLRIIGTKVDKIGSKLDNHIGWHEGQKVGK